MENTDAKMTTIDDQRHDTETGLMIRNNFKSDSGFDYMTGIRKFENLKIVEGISKGTATILLTSVMVFDSNNVLIFDADISRMTNYSRDKVRQIVLAGMMNMLRESCENNGKYFDENEAYQLLDKKLKLVYYQESYDAALRWAAEIGIKIF